MKIIKIITISAILLLNTSFALTLSEAKKTGRVIELKNGYIKAAKSKPKKEVKDLVKTVNKKRKVLYKNIAKELKVPVSKVEKNAGKKNTSK